MDVRQQLLDFGTPPALAEVAIPSMFNIPSASAPRANSTILMVKGVQRALKRLGFPVRVTGFVDSATERGLEAVSGPAWSQEKWFLIYEDLASALRNPKKHAMQKAASLHTIHAMGAVSDDPQGPTAVDQGVPLTFGESGQVMVPIPKSSGATSQAFRDLQRQVNRLLSRKGGRIDEDGLIGPETLAGYQKVKGELGWIQQIFVPSSTKQLAGIAVSTARALRKRADELGISNTANRGSGSTSTSRSISTPPPLPPGAASGGGFTKYLPFLGIGVAAFWFAKNSKKGRRR